MLYRAVLVSAIQYDSATGKHMSPPPELASHSPPHSGLPGYHRAVGWTPCIPQEIPTGYLLYLWSLYVSKRLPFVSPLPSPAVSTSLFSVCLSIAILQIGSSVHLSRYHVAEILLRAAEMHSWNIVSLLCCWFDPLLLQFHKETFVSLKDIIHYMLSLYV